LLLDVIVALSILSLDASSKIRITGCRRDALSILSLDASPG